jgi:hypothetical protein
VLTYHAANYRIREIKPIPRGLDPSARGAVSERFGNSHLIRTADRAEALDRAWPSYREHCEDHPRALRTGIQILPSGNTPTLRWSDLPQAARPIARHCHDQQRIATGLAHNLSGGARSLSLLNEACLCERGSVG